MALKDILLKLANGDNQFSATVFGQDRTGKIVEINLERTEVKMRFCKPVLKTIRVEVESKSWGLDRDDDHTEWVNKEVETWEEWLTVPESKYIPSLYKF
jgi:hypothetical protein